MVLIWNKHINISKMCTLKSSFHLIGIFPISLLAKFAYSSNLFAIFSKCSPYEFFSASKVLLRIYISRFLSFFSYYFLLAMFALDRVVNNWLFVNLLEVVNLDRRDTILRADSGSVSFLGIKWCPSFLLFAGDTLVMSVSFTLELLIYNLIT